MEEKGCVYFFKHIGLTPIKIGFSNSESPLKRFEQFKTYAPYGSELIGFIITNEAKKLETLLHLKFSNKRLKGEWFELSMDEVKSNIDLYTGIEQANDMNDFIISYAKTKEISSEFYTNEFKLTADSEYKELKVIGKKELFKIVGEKKYNDFINAKVSDYKPHRVGLEVKRGFLLYFKEQPCNLLIS